MKLEIIFLVILSVLFFGCTAATYQPNVHTYNMLTGQEIKDKAVLKSTPAPTFTTFEQWPSLWAAVCGTVITDADGKIVGNISGNCGTPLTIFMSSTLNIGLATAATSAIHP